MLAIKPEHPPEGDEHKPDEHKVDAAVDGIEVEFPDPPEILVDETDAEGL